MSEEEKRCYYEVLGLPQSCSPDEIRSSYKKLALQRHPDKLIQSGVATTDATAAFQELVRAYEVLSDPKERSWYDSHRSQILYSSSSNSNSSSSSNRNNNNHNGTIPDLFSFFSASCYTDFTNPKTGFYKVYGDVFDRVFANEVNYCRRMGLGLGLVEEAPVMGDLGSDYGQVTAFYGYWLGFSTVMDFGWVDKWDAMAGESRRDRRLMEEENKKGRKKAKREFNDTVRGLAAFVKKRDKRVIEMNARKEKEREKKREEEARKKKEKEREKLERIKAYQEPAWARVDEIIDCDEEEEEEEEEEEVKPEFYCAACGKKFKSDKQWKNHEQSKKHKERVAELRKFFKEEDKEFEGTVVDDDDDDEEEGGSEIQEDVEVIDEKDDSVLDGFISAEDDVDELGKQFREGVEVTQEKGTHEIHSDNEDGRDELNEKPIEIHEFKEGQNKDEVFSDCEDGVGNVEHPNGVEQSAATSDKEVTILEAMISGRRPEKHVSFKDQSDEVNHAQSEDETESMEYNNKKGKKKSRRAKKDKGKASDGSNDLGENSKAPGASNVAADGDDVDEYHDKYGRSKAGKKKRDAESKAKSSSKGRKQKEKYSDPVCEKCGEEFDSRNQLYKHINDTGHASLKSK